MGWTSTPPDLEAHVGPGSAADVVPPGPTYCSNRKPDPDPDDRFCDPWCLCCVVVFLLVFGYASIDERLYHRPEYPKFYVSGFNFSSFNLSSTETLSSEFNINISFTVRNPNSNSSIVYDNVTAVIVYGSSDLIKLSRCHLSIRTRGMSPISRRN